MIAENKKDFIDQWEQHSQALSGLYNTAETIETIEKIKAAIDAVNAVIREVADEGYQECAMEYRHKTPLNRQARGEIN